MFRSSLNSECKVISLIQQCRLLEEPYGTNFTDAVLQGDSSLSSVRKDLLKKNRQWQDSLISQHDSLKHLESLKYVPWYKVWDAVLDSGPNAAKYASSVFNILLRCNSLPARTIFLNSLMLRERTGSHWAQTLSVWKPWDSSDSLIVLEWEWGLLALPSR